MNQQQREMRNRIDQITMNEARQRAVDDAVARYEIPACIRRGRHRVIYGQTHCPDCQIRLPEFPDPTPPAQA